MDFATFTKNVPGICVLAKFNPIELIGCLILRPGLTNSLAHVITKCCDLSRFVRKHNLTVARISAASICKNGVRKERHYPSKWTLLTNINIKSVDVKQSTRKLPSTKGRRFASGVEKISVLLKVLPPWIQLRSLELILWNVCFRFPSFCCHRALERNIFSWVSK